MSLGTQINFKQLFECHANIRVPMIQRDYAQGRPAEAEVREEFLKAIKNALDKPANDPSLPLNLDFIYGSVEGDEHTLFLPLDGQQRLTTLFLLHWYLAWEDNQWDTFERLFVFDGHSRFAYSVRPSSNEFFDQLVVHQPDSRPEEVSSLGAMISNQHWYFRSWRLDPTIQAVLHMLDAIHSKFCNSNGLFGRLLDEKRPAITFHLLNLKNFGLSDDLYIKMNARGKPLTAFETFKARYEQELKNQFPGEPFSIGDQSFKTADYVARRMDTTWANLFWRHRNPGNNLFDSAFMNVFRAVALISRDPESPEYLEDVNKIRNAAIPPSYSDFHLNKWLDESFTRTLINLLDLWSRSGNELYQCLPDSRYIDEKLLFGDIVSKGANLYYSDLVQFHAYALFIMKHNAAINGHVFQEWMRIVRNLAVNTDYNRPDDFRRSVRGLMDLLEYSSDILEHFVRTQKAATGFNELQITEERIKAKLIRAHEGWRPLIDRAESHGYFCGQIDFLLDFAGCNAKAADLSPDMWDTSEHISKQEAFSRYCDLAEKMFSSDGLVYSREHLWQRAMLCFGDYLLPSGPNRSFLVNSSTDEASWKRLLSGSNQRAITARKTLKELMKKLSPNVNLSEQLESIIKGVEGLDPWRKAMVDCPAVLSYCQRSVIRENHGVTYLLARSRMNAQHAELFTYSLYQKLSAVPSKENLAPLILSPYYFPQDTATDPGIRFFLDSDKFYIFDLDGNKSGFVLYCSLGNGDELPALVNFLVKKDGYALTEQRLERKCAHSDIFAVIDDLRRHIIEFTKEKDCNAK